MENAYDAKYDVSCEENDKKTFWLKDNYGALAAGIKKCESKKWKDIIVTGLMRLAKWHLALQTVAFCAFFAQYLRISPDITDIEIVGNGQGNWFFEGCDN